MISVVLMLVLVTSVVMVFTHSSEVFSISESKMEVYQNARAAFELITRELTSADNATGLSGYTTFTGFSFANPGSVGTNLTIFQFKTNTSWSGTSGRESGTAVVEYYLKRMIKYPKLWELKRKVIPAGTSSAVVDNILAQYLPYSTSSIKIGYFEYVGSNWVYREPANHSINVGNPLPSAIRITINFTDKLQRVTRTLSKTVWIPKGQ